MCQPKALPTSAARTAEFRPASIPAGLPAEEFAEQEAALDCSVLCVSEPREACVAIYFNQGRKECRLLLFTDATVDMGDARGWRKLALIK